jgi:hypothetical protein
VIVGFERELGTDGNQRVLRYCPEFFAHLLRRRSGGARLLPEVEPKVLAKAWCLSPIPLCGVPGLPLESVFVGLGASVVDAVPTENPIRRQCL